MEWDGPTKWWCSNCERDWWAVSGVIWTIFPDWGFLVIEVLILLLMLCLHNKETQKGFLCVILGTRARQTFFLWYNWYIIILTHFFYFFIWISFPFHTKHKKTPTEEPPRTTLLHAAREKLKARAECRRQVRVGNWKWKIIGVEKWNSFGKRWVRMTAAAAVMCVCFLSFCSHVINVASPPFTYFSL